MAATHNIVIPQSDLLGQLAQARRRTDQLFAIVRPEALYDRPIAERHRIIFYVGHLEAFDWNLLHERALAIPPFQTEFDKLFAFGIDPVDGGLPSDQPADWPSLAQVQRYVEQVRQTIDDGIAELIVDEQQQVHELSLSTLLHVAIEHRLMHAETLAYMLHQLPYERKIAHADPPLQPAARHASSMVRIPAGTATLGLSRGDQNQFGWDNEYDMHTVKVDAFAMDSHMVTNRQFLEFLEAGGYEDASLWNASDWDWKIAAQLHHPVFWEGAGERWFYRTMFEDVSLPLDWPVYVSHAEASAYARWAGKELPTEAQWHRAAYGTPDGEEQDFPWGSTAPGPLQGNFDFHRWDPVPVGSYPQGRSAFGLYDMLGNGWEWTSTPFAPFAGFRPFSFYPGYSADFFDGKHYVMKGGSARTAAGLLRRSFRNWFQPRYPYVYAGFRCITQE